MENLGMACRMLRPALFAGNDYIISNNVWLYYCNGSKKSADAEKGAPCGSTLAPAGSNWSSRRSDETAEASDVEGHLLDSASLRAAACGQLRPGQKGDVKADPDVEGEGKNTQGSCRMQKT
jgi:hypothetical protein